MKYYRWESYQPNFKVINNPKMYLRRGGTAFKEGGVEKGYNKYLAVFWQPAVVCFFRARVLFSMENAKFWPILTNLGYFIANLRTFRCTFYRAK